MGQVFNYFIPQGLFTDPNLDVISYEAHLVNSSTLPDWLVFNGILATFTGTTLPPIDFNNAYQQRQQQTQSVQPANTESTAPAEAAWEKVTVQ